MSTYSLMQLSPGGLRQKIRDATGQHKWYLIYVLLLRDLALLGFAIAYIASFSLLFGASSGYVGVASFCILLSLRFVNYGYNFRASLIALFVIFGLMGVNSVVLPLLGPVASLGLNLASLLLILRLTSDTPILGNGGVYTFAYVLVTGIPVTSAEIMQRGAASLLAAVLCGMVFWLHHRHANREISVRLILKWPGLNNATCRWQLRLALGVSLAIFVGQLMGVDRTMWLGFASMSALLPQTTLLRGRATMRFSGVVVGSLLFAGLLAILPARTFFLLAPIAGFCLGLTPSYFLASIFNCFGALSIAYTLFGLVPATLLRIGNNGIGIAVALVVAYGLNAVWHHFYQEAWA